MEELDLFYFSEFDEAEKIQLYSILPFVNEGLSRFEKKIKACNQKKNGYSKKKIKKLITTSFSSLTPFSSFSMVRFGLLTSLSLIGLFIIAVFSHPAYGMTGKRSSKYSPPLNPEAIYITPQNPRVTYNDGYNSGNFNKVTNYNANGETVDSFTFNPNRPGDFSQDDFNESVSFRTRSQKRKLFESPITNGETVDSFTFNPNRAGEFSNDDFNESGSFRTRSQKRKLFESPMTKGIQAGEIEQETKQGSPGDLLELVQNHGRAQNNAVQTRSQTREKFLKLTSNEGIEQETKQGSPGDLLELVQNHGRVQNNAVQQRDRDRSQMNQIGFGQRVEKPNAARSLFGGTRDRGAARRRFQIAAPLVFNSLTGKLEARENLDHVVICGESVRVKDENCQIQNHGCQHGNLLSKQEIMTDLQGRIDRELQICYKSMLETEFKDVQETKCCEHVIITTRRSFGG